MSTLKCYVLLCIFPIKVFPVYEDIYHADKPRKEPSNSDGIESKSTTEQSDDKSEKEPHMPGGIVNTFKKPFININQVRNGWPEESLILKIMGTSPDNIEEGGTPYQSSVRSLGFTTHLNTSTKFKS